MGALTNDHHTCLKLACGALNACKLVVDVEDHLQGHLLAPEAFAGEADKLCNADWLHRSGVVWAHRASGAASLNLHDVR